MLAAVIAARRWRLYRRGGSLFLRFGGQDIELEQSDLDAIRNAPGAGSMRIMLNAIPDLFRRQQLQDALSANCAGHQSGMFAEVQAAANQAPIEER